MSSKHTLEIVYRIWNHQGADHIDIGDDSDGCGLTEIRFVDDTEQIISRIDFNDDQLSLLFEAIQLRLRDLKTKKATSE